MWNLGCQQKDHQWAGPPKYCLLVDCKQRVTGSEVCADLIGCQGTDHPANLLELLHQPENQSDNLVVMTSCHVGGLAAALTESEIDKENCDFFNASGGQGNDCDSDSFTVVHFGGEEERRRQKEGEGFEKKAFKKRRTINTNEEDEDEEGGEEVDGHGMNSEERVKIAVDWIKRNFYEHPTGSVSRSNLYEAYKTMCESIESQPMNMATLGKHIRTLFPAIITRRLGNRGNSKYHYYGLSATRDSMIVQVEDNSNSASACGNSSVASGSAKKPRIPKFLKEILAKKETGKALSPVQRATQQQQAQPQKTLRSIASKSWASDQRIYPTQAPTSNYQYQTHPRQQQQQQLQSPDFEEFSRLLNEICTFAVGNPFNAEPFQQFSQDYQAHTLTLLKRICMKDFISVEALIQEFWSKLDEGQLEVLLSEEAVRLVCVADDYLYQVAINILLPDVIDPVQLANLQTIRIFAKSVDGWFATINIETGIPSIFGNIRLGPKIVEAKVDMARRFSMILRRRTSVNHLVQASQSVIRNRLHVQQMAHDWDHVDFGTIRDQVAWIIGMKEPFISYIELSVKSYLIEEAPIVLWTQWLENLIEQFIAVEMAAGKTLDKAAKMLILGWSFYHTMLLRDLTLRSASSFGSFHILRLFLEEYLMYYVERKLDEHRRAVGILTQWPTTGISSSAPSTTSSSSGNEMGTNRSPSPAQHSHGNGLHLMSSAADHLSSDDEVTIHNGSILVPSRLFESDDLASYLS